MKGEKGTRDQTDFVEGTIQNLVSQILEEQSETSESQTFLGAGEIQWVGHLPYTWLTWICTPVPHMIS